MASLWIFWKGKEREKKESDFNLPTSPKRILFSSRPLGEDLAIRKEPFALPAKSFSPRSPPRVDIFQGEKFSRLFQVSSKSIRLSEQGDDILQKDEIACKRWRTRQR